MGGWCLVFPMALVGDDVVILSVCVGEEDGKWVGKIGD